MIAGCSSPAELAVPGRAALHGSRSVAHALWQVCNLCQVTSAATSVSGVMARRFTEESGSQRNSVTPGAAPWDRRGAPVEIPQLLAVPRECERPSGIMWCLCGSLMLQNPGQSELYAMIGCTGGRCWAFVDFMARADRALSSLQCFVYPDSLPGMRAPGTFKTTLAGQSRICQEMKGRLISMYDFAAIALCLCPL